MNFEEYYKSFGFIKYPFGVFTSEAETDIFSEIYMKPQNHSVIEEGLRNTSAIIIGERGTGKTALSLDMGLKLSQKNHLLVRIEEFSSLKENYETEDLYKFLIERLASGFFMSQTEYPNKLWNYTKEDRIDLSMYLHKYLGATTKAMLKDKINKIQNSLMKRIAIGGFNISRIAINYGLKAAITITNDALTKHFSSLPTFDSENTEYFKKIESEIDDSFNPEQKQYFYLEKLCRLIQKSGIEKIYIIIDKIDEDSRFDSDAENIADYLRKLASNNKILTNDLFHTLLFVWSTPFNYVKDVVRTQKLSFFPLSWDRSELEKVLQRRLCAYSGGSISQVLEILGSCNENSLDILFEMCNKNPRDLWHILNKTFQEQFSIDSSSKIGDQAIESAIKKFVIEFNYYEYYPKKSNSRANTMDVYKYIKHLQKLDNPQFTKDKLNSMAGTGGSTNNYVVAMENMGLVRNTNEKAQGGAILYEIIDPKVRYAMRHGISINV
jgi:hypothetical protein